jgi:hypothetical protein
MARQLCSDDTRIDFRPMRAALPATAARGQIETAALYLLACLFWATIVFLALQAGLG